MRRMRHDAADRTIHRCLHDIRGRAKALPVKDNGIGELYTWIVCQQQVRKRDGLERKQSLVDKGLWGERREQTTDKPLKQAHRPRPRNLRTCFQCVSFLGYAYGRCSTPGDFGRLGTALFQQRTICLLTVDIAHCEASREGLRVATRQRYGGTVELQVPRIDDAGPQLLCPSIKSQAVGWRRRTGTVPGRSEQHGRVEFLEGFQQRICRGGVANIEKKNVDEKCGGPVGGDFRQDLALQSVRQRPAGLQVGEIAVSGQHRYDGRSQRRLDYDRCDIIEQVLTDTTLGIANTKHIDEDKCRARYPDTGESPRLGGEVDTRDHRIHEANYNPAESPARLLQSDKVLTMWAVI